MVSAKTIIILGGLALFFVAGGVGISKSAFGQASTDLKALTGNITQNTTIRNVLDNFQKRRADMATDKAGETIF